MDSIKLLANQNDGKLDRRTYHVAECAIKLNASLQNASISGTEADMKVVVANYNAYRQSLGLK